DLHRNQIVPARGDRQFLREVRRLEIRDEKDNRPPIDNAVEITQRLTRIGSPPFRFKKQDVADQPQCVHSPLLWRDEMLDMIPEENQPNSVALSGCAEPQQTSHLRRQLAFRKINAPKLTRSTHI